MKRLMLLVRALVLGLALFACGGSSPSNPSPTPTDTGAPPPPVIVCNPMYPPALATDWVLHERAAVQVVLTQKAAIRLTFAWTPPTALTGVYVLPDTGSFCPLGNPCAGALVPDYTPTPSPKVVQTKVLEPGAYIEVIENMSGPAGVLIGGDTKVEICK